MQKSFLARLFPEPDEAILPQHERRLSSSRTKPLNVGKSSRTSSRSVSQSISHATSSKSTSLREAPLIASIVHHDNPFLPIERAARSLQANIQDFLDAQSDALSRGTQDIDSEDVQSTGTITPIQSVKTWNRSPNTSRTIPVRQPAKKVVTLRNARRGISKSMKAYAQLRDDEARVLDAEALSRTEAIARIGEIDNKTETLTLEIEAIHGKDSATRAAKLRSEAVDIQHELEQLEIRMLELRNKRQYLLNQAITIERSTESQASSYQYALADVKKKTAAFLQRPPISQPFVHNSTSSSASVNMYSLRSERRTLEMAREQWSTELDLISRRKDEVVEERDALLDGEKLWMTAVGRISAFERHLRNETRSLMQLPTASPALKDQESASSTTSAPIDQLLNELETLLHALKQDLASAGQRQWNLLVCALGAEIEALIQGQELLQHTRSDSSNEAFESSTRLPQEGQMDLMTDERHDSQHSHQLLPESRSPAGSEQSNQSLTDTLAVFDSDRLNGNEWTRNESRTPPVRAMKPRDLVEHKHESEDDEPPNDFFVSH